MFTVPLITAKYRVNPENSVEEKLFNNEDNPSPLLELVGQELAMQTSGIVKVYIDTLGDISRIRNVLKVSNTFFLAPFVNIGSRREQNFSPLAC